MDWAQNFSSKTPLKKLNWSSTTGFSYKTLCIRPAQNPEKSRDFISKNPRIFINLKSRDPGIPGIPLRPAQDTDGILAAYNANLQCTSVGDGQTQCVNTPHRHQSEIWSKQRPSWVRD